MYQHWLELCVNREKLKIDLDKERYAQLEKLKMFYLVTARQDAKLVGYLMSFVMPHFHYKSSGEQAVTDMYWMHPDDRHGMGLKLFLRWERDMRARGVTMMITSCKIAHDQTPFLKALDWVHTDNTLCKFL
jgi:hypothetical protein